MSTTYGINCIIQSISTCGAGSWPQLFAVAQVLHVKKAILNIANMAGPP